MGDFDLLNHPLALGCRYLDALSEEIGADEAAIKLGLDPTIVHYIAHQHAIRVALAITRPELLKKARGLGLKESFDIRPTDEEMSLIRLATVGETDGMVIGYYVHKLEVNGVKED